jgi:Ca2+-binding EF-hand superfamily protein
MSSNELLKALLGWELQATREEVEALIASCDTNGDGVIDYDEFMQGVMKVSLKHPDNPLAYFGANDRGVTDAYRVHGSGQVFINDNLGVADKYAIGKKPMAYNHELGKETGKSATDNELKGYMSALKGAIETKYKMIRSAFRSLDKDGSNHLTKDEIVNAVQHFALPIPLSHIGEIFDKILDIDGDGKISYVEFCQKLQDCEG